MMSLEHANARLIAAAAAALLDHARNLAASGASLEDMNESLARYVDDLEHWRSSAYARMRRACCAEPPSMSVH